MAFYGDVMPGDEFRPSAALSNDVRHFLNSLNGFGNNRLTPNGAGTVRIQIYNALENSLEAGTAVNFDDSSAMAGEAVPVKPLSDPRKPWGVIPQKLQAKEMGDCLISGPVTVTVTGTGDFAQPSAASPTSFTRGAEGAPVLFAHGAKAVINLGAGTPEHYDGPFALAYDTEKKLLKVKAGYLSRNGEFVAVPAAELTPATGLVCVASDLGNGAWSEPVVGIGSPSATRYPIGQCKVAGESVTVTSFHVPVAILIVTALCPLSAKADDEGGNA